MRTARWMIVAAGFVLSPIANAENPPSPPSAPPTAQPSKPAEPPAKPTEPPPAPPSGAPTCDSTNEQTVAQCYTAIKPKTDACFDKVPHDKPKGVQLQLLVKYDIEYSGAVNNVSFDEDKSTEKNAAVRSCIEGVMRSIKFESTPLPSAGKPGKKRIRTHMFYWMT